MLRIPFVSVRKVCASQLFSGWVPIFIFSLSLFDTLRVSYEPAICENICTFLSVSFLDFLHYIASLPGLFISSLTLWSCDCLPFWFIFFDVELLSPSRLFVLVLCGILGFCGDLYYSVPHATYTYVVVVGLTLTPSHNAMQSLVAGQAPKPLEWKKCLDKRNKQSVVHMILKHIYISDKA